MHFSTFFLLKYNELGLTGVQKVLNGGKFTAQKTRKMQLLWWRVLQKTTATRLQCSIWNGIECWKPHNKVVITKLKIKSFWREKIAKDNCFLNKAVFLFYTRKSDKICFDHQNQYFGQNKEHFLCFEGFMSGWRPLQ